MKNKVFGFSLLLVFGFAVTPHAQNYGISTYAGNGISGFAGDGSAATNAKLNIPYGVAIDGSGNLYLADTHNNRIREVNTSGTISTVAGNGTLGFSGDGSAATNAKLNNPTAVTADAAGNLYIADGGNYCIRMVNTSGIISTVAGNKTQGFSGDGGAATSAQLNSQCGVSTDATGNLYIADTYNNRVRLVNTSGIISTVAGDTGRGYSGDGVAATTTELWSPWDVAIDASGNIYIADVGNYRIRLVNKSGIISTIAGNGISNFSGDGGPATSAELSFPIGVKLDASGNIYIDDYLNYVIRYINTSGIISTIAGNGTSGFSGDGGAAIAAELDSVTAIAVNSAGNVYFSERDSRVRNLCFAPATPGNIKGNSFVCSGISSIYSITPVTGATSYTWTLPPGWNGSSTTNSITATTGLGNGTIEVVANNSCGPSAAQTLSLSVQSPQAVSICYVSVDTNSVHNDILWDKSGLDTMAIDSFRVYRKIASSYVQIGSTSPHAFPSFIDPTSNPNTASQLYEISILDTCGQESILSAAHQTILLQANLGVGNVVNLDWSAYVGNTVSYYRILRDDLGNGNWHALDSVPNTVFSYTDLTPPASPNVRYMLNTIWSLTCSPKEAIGRHATGNSSQERTASLNNYTFTSYSNYKLMDVTGINNITEPSFVNVYPNPVKDIVTLTFQRPIDGTITITNMVGQQVYSDYISANSTTKQLNISALSEGVYVIKITSNGQSVVQRVVKL